MIKSIVTILLKITLIFSFLPVFVCYYAPNRTVPYFIFFVTTIFLTFFIIEPYKTIKKLVSAYKYTSFRYLCYFFMWIFISSFICYFLGRYNSFSQVIMALIGGFLLRCIFVYIFPIFMLSHKINLKYIIKFFIIAYFTIFVWGLCEFFAAKYGIDVLNKLVYFFSNYKAEELSIVIESNSGLPRIRSVFQEAGFLSKFIAINLPIIYSLSLSNYKIFRNKYVNYFFKKTIIPLTWINILLTQSPIFLIVNILVTGIYFYRKIFSFIKQNYKIILISIFFLFLLAITSIMLCRGTNIEKSFISRIFNVISIIPTLTIEKLIMVEPSLATRIVCYIDLFLLFLHYPILGIGFLNRGHILLNFMQNSPIPLTPELITRFSLSTNVAIVNVTTLTELLYQTGIIGIIIYCLFMITTIKKLSIVKYNFYGIEFVFVNSLKNSILILFVLALTYEQSFIENHTFFYPGLAAAIILIAQRNRRLLNWK